MAIEPVNERPIFPSLTRLDAVGVGHWSVSMIRQLTTVFQQYGYKLNQTLLDEDLAENGGTIPEVDRTNTWVPAQVFQTAPTATGHPLRWDELAANGGTIPEVDRTNVWTERQQYDQDFTSTNGGIEVTRASNSAGDIARFLDINSPDVVSADFNLRVGRGTDTTGDIRIFFFNGDNTSGSWFAASKNEGIQVGNPGGGFQGAGTLNAQAVYDDGSLLTDYVFDGEIDQQIDTEFYDHAVPNREIKDENGKVLRIEKRVHTPARQFSRNMDELDPKGFENKWRTTRKLPAMARASKKPSLGEYAQALLETCEVQAVHIAKLEARIQALEDKQ